MANKFDPILGKYRQSDSDGSGDVDGPASSTDNAIARYDGVTGKLIQDSAVTIDDTGVISQSTPVTGNVLNLATTASATDKPAINLANGRALLGFNGTNAMTTVQAGTGKGIEFNVNNSVFGSGQAMTLTSAGLLGIATTAATHSLTLASTATGISYYNTTDQTTNYERLRHYWTANTYTMITESGGTGSLRAITINGAQSFITLNGTNITMGRGGTGNNNIVTHSATFTSSSSVQALTYIAPTITQTGTAGYTALLINLTETTTGSGQKFLIDAQIGGTSRMWLSNSGTLSIGSVSGGFVAYNTADAGINYERIRMFFTGNTATIATESAGTGVVRSLSIGTSARRMTFVDTPSASGIFQIGVSTATVDAAGLVVSGVMNQPSGGFTASSVNVTSTQTGAVLRRVCRRTQ